MPPLSYSHGGRSRQTTRRLLIPSPLAAIATLVLATVFCLHSTTVSATNQFSWMKRDVLDDIFEKMDRVNPDNCAFKSESELRLPATAMSNLPQYNTILQNQWFENRTRNLLHMHSMALNRGYFFSYILQRLNTSENDFADLPGFQYYYLSVASDVTANPGIINSSAVLMDTNCTYPNWYPNILKFNSTLPLFGPKAIRKDDYNDNVNWLREPTNHTIDVFDMGSGQDHNYTAPWYRNNPYILDKEMQIEFIPDNIRTDSGKKMQYVSFIRHADLNGIEMKPREETPFFGPPSPAEKESFQPVRFTRPYYDCGKSNRWIVSAVAPVVDYMKRYSNQTRLRGPQIVGLITMDTDYWRVDFNPCPASLGNPDHYLAGIARCKRTTMCEPLPWFGLHRGGYQCVCDARHRFPFYQNGPFQGVDIEQATEQEYKNGFECIPIDWLRVRLSVLGLEGNLERKKRSTDSFSDNIVDWAKSAASTVTGAVKNTWKYLSKEAPKEEEEKEEHHQHFAPRHTPPPLKPRPSVFGIEFNSNVTREDVDAARLRYKQKLAPKFPGGGPPETPPKVTIKGPKGDRKEKLLSRHKRDALYYRGKLTGFDAIKYEEAKKIVSRIKMVSPTNCVNFTNDQLEFPGEVSYGVETQFETQGRTALRLAHFLSAMYQNYVKGEDYGNLQSDKLLNKYQLFGEVIANTMSDFNVYGSGIYFDYQKFRLENGDRYEAFAPYAYRAPQQNMDNTESNTAASNTVITIPAVDLSILEYRDYFEKPFFKHLKERWASNTYGLERQVLKPMVRSDMNGTASRKYDNYPVYFHAPRYEDGYWTKPYFDCNGFIKDWVITYSTPFFGYISDVANLQFMGVVSITVKLEELDINQCPMSFYTPNYFKNTAICDYRTQYCMHIPRRRFELGSYKCECRQGYELPFDDPTWFFEGQTMEKEYQKKMDGEPSLYDLERCREGGAGTIKATLILVNLVVSFVCGLIYTL